MVVVFVVLVVVGCYDELCGSVVGLNVFVLVFVWCSFFMLIGSDGVVDFDCCVDVLYWCMCENGLFY